MFSGLLVIIYISFISLGLPDAIMGSAWPIIHEELNISVSYVGIFYMIVSGGTIISSFFSEKLIRRFGTGTVTAFSVMLTAAPLLLMRFAPEFWVICLLGIPLGLGAGAVDSALNNFVALHYAARHMNWLHSFWGVGATAGPFVMSFFLMRTGGWRTGYTVIGTAQAVLVLILVISLPVWRRAEKPSSAADASKRTDTSLKTLLSIRGAKPALLSFFCYCAVEATTGLWGASYLVIYRHLSAETAAQWVSMYYFGIAAGRFITGIASSRLTNNMLIRIGQCTALGGAVLLLLPSGMYFQLAGLLLVGLGCAPIFPSMLHETPRRFGEERSQGLMGIQMSCAYVGSTFIPPVFGALATKAGFWLFPFFIAGITALMLLTSERVAAITNKNKT